MAAVVVGAAGGIHLDAGQLVLPLRDAFGEHPVLCVDPAGRWAGRQSGLVGDCSVLGQHANGEQQDPAWQISAAQLRDRSMKSVNQRAAMPVQANVAGGCVDSDQVSVSAPQLLLLLLLR